MRGSRRIGGLRFPVLVLLFAGAVGLALLSGESTWWHSWRQSVDNAVGAVTIIGPLLAGLVAASYGSLCASSWGDLVVASARPVRAWYSPALRAWAAAVAGLVLALVVLLVRFILLDVPLPLRPFAIVPLGMLVLGVHALVGLVIGLRASPRTAPVLAVLVSFALFLLAGSHLAPPSFVTGGVTGSMYGEQYRLGSVAALCAFAVLSALALVPWSRRSEARARARVRWAVSGAAVVATLGLAQVTWPDVESRLEAIPVAYRCGGADPAICMIAERPGADFAATARRMRELAQPLTAIGVTLPQRWRQVHYGQPAEPATGRLIVGDDAPTDADLVRSLVEPAECPQYPDGNEPAAVFGGRVQIMNWLVVRNGLDKRSTAPRWFSSRRSEEYVRATYAQLSRCELDAVRRP